MTVVKLHTNISGTNGVAVEDGAVVNLPDDYAQHLINIRVAELSDEKTTAEYNENYIVPAEPEPGEVVAPPASAPQNTEPVPDGFPAPTHDPSTPEANTPPADEPAPTNNLHLG